MALAPETGGLTAGAGRVARDHCLAPARSVDEATAFPAFHSLAARDLQRGQALGLPAGEDVAQAMGEEPLWPDEVALGEAWSGPTPRWLYVMREDDIRCDGDRLGRVGGRIVAEVLLGIVDADPASYRSVDPSWRPTLPALRDGSFGLTDLLAFQRSPADSRRP
jgi:hypothetical protein